MKKTLIAGLLSLGVVGAYAQGTVSFNDLRNNLVVMHIYSPQLTTPTVEVIGNVGTAYNASTAPGGDFPAGGTSTVIAFTASINVTVAPSLATFTGQRIGGASAADTGTPNYTAGNQFEAQLEAASGTGVALSSLLPVSQYTANLYALAGTAVAGTWVAPSLSSDPGINGTSGGIATVAVAAWYTDGGTITTLAQAETAGTGVWGESNEVTLNNLGGIGSPPGPAEPLFGIESFSLRTNVPEPSTVALGVMGVCGFLARRRKK